MTHTQRQSLPFTTSFIPETRSLYQIVVNKQSVAITDVLSGKILEPDSQGFYHLKIYDEPYQVTYEWLICFTYKPLYNAKSFAHKWTVGVKDNNETLIHPDNLFWITEVTGTECPELPGFKIVPGFSRIAVSRDGVPYNRAKAQYQSIRTGKVAANGKYLITGLMSDVGETQTVGIHRIVYTAHNAVNENPDRLVIKHKDGKKTNNSLDNLEIQNYSQNLLGTKSHKTNRLVVVRDYQDKTETIYRNSYDVAVDIRTHPSMISEYLTKKQTHLLLNRYKLRYNDDIQSFPWDDSKDLNFKKLEKFNVEIPCVARNIFTNQYYFADSHFELASLIGEKTSDVFTGIVKVNKIPINGFIYADKTDKDKLKIDYDEVELEFFRQNRTASKPIRFTWGKVGDNSRQCKVFASVNEAYQTLSSAFNKGPYALKERTDGQNSGSFVVNDYAFEFKKLWH